MLTINNQPEDDEHLGVGPGHLGLGLLLMHLRVLVNHRLLYALNQEIQDAPPKLCFIVTILNIWLSNIHPSPAIGVN